MAAACIELQTTGRQRQEPVCCVMFENEQYKCSYTGHVITCVSKMAAGGGEEKQFIGKLLPKQTKYGTNSKLTQKNSVFIKHSIIKGDTLMGIALKYGVTVEQIKRENKLWTNDSLFLREHLLIPIQNEDISLVPESCETVVIDNTPRSRSSSQKSNASDDNDKLVHKSEQTTHHTNGESGMDFLSKYDNSIAQLKSNVDQMAKNASCLPVSVTENAYTYPRRKTSQRPSHNSIFRKGSLDNGSQYKQFYDNEGYSGSEKDLTNSPVLMIKSKSNIPQVRTSLDRIERQNDEMFEL